ncbi:MAG: sialidase family protein [Acidobacteriota bacterium]
MNPTRSRVATVAAVLLAIPALAGPIGPGGGGAFYSPSINPGNGAELYVSSDMSDVFHSQNYGAAYSLVDFRQVQGGVDSRVRFTNNPNIVYTTAYINDVGTPVKSTDGGATFTVVPGNPDGTEHTYSINVDYANPNRVVIAYYGLIYVSNDGGATFSLVHTAINNGSGCVVGGAFFDGNNVYLGTNDGLLASSDGGATFQTSPAGGIPGNEAIFSFAGAKQGGTTRFFCLTSDPANIYAGLTGADYYGFLSGIYSLDLGAPTWVSRMNGISVGNDFPMFVAMAENDVNTVYATGSSTAGEPLVLKTTNAGGLWSNTFLATNNQNVVTGWSGDGGDRGWGYGECTLGVGVSPTDANRIAITDYGFIHLSSDGGTTWRQGYVSQSDENAAGGQTPQGKAYHSVGAEDTSCWQVLWVDQQNLFAPYTDIRGTRSTDGGASWSFAYTGLNGNTTYRAVRHPATGTLYAATSNIHDIYESTRLTDAYLDAADSNGKIIFSTDLGATWQDLHVFGHPVYWVALDPTNQNRMYASVIHSTQGGVFVSSDIQNGAGSTWNPLPAPPRTEGHPCNIVVLNDGSVVATYSGHRTSAFTASSGTFVYNGGTWTDVSDAGMQYWTRDITIDPYDASQNTWFVGVFSGWGGPPNGLGGLYRTTNRGQSWTRISALDRVHGCTISPVTPGAGYLTTEYDGLWQSSDLDAATPTVTQVAGYGFRHPERVFYNPYNTSEVWVTSFGNGITILGGGGNSGGPNVVAGPGPGPTNAPNVRGFDTAGAANGATDFTAYAAGGYGANVALADVRGAGQTGDILTGPGPGAVYGPQVRAFRRSGASTAKVNFYAYGTLRYGVNVSSGDVERDSVEEIVTGAGPGAVFGPHVRGFNFDGGTVSAISKISFFAFGTLRYGARVAGADIDGDGYAELLACPGPSAAFGAQVRGFNYDGATVSAISKVNYTAYAFVYGTHVEGGDLDADGIEEILTAPGPDPAANARIRGWNYDGANLTAIAAVDFDGMPGVNRQGATVDAYDIDADGFAEIVVGMGYDGASGGPHVRGWNYDGGTVGAISTLDFFAFAAGQRYGVNVTVDELVP